VVGFASFDGDARKKAADLRAKVKVRTGEPYRGAYPAAWGAEVTVRLNDVSRIAVARTHCKGDPEAALDRDGMIAKARELLAFGGIADAEPVIDGVLAMAAGGAVPDLALR
jgi:2-methylcitrate dehydratase PrpD